MVQMVSSRLERALDLIALGFSDNGIALVAATALLLLASPPVLSQPQCASQKNMTCDLPAPIGLAVASSNPTAVSLSWQHDSPEEEGFRACRKAGAAGPWVRVDDDDLVADSTSHVDVVPVCGGTYAYRVWAYSFVDGLLCESEESNEAAVEVVCVDCVGDTDTGDSDADGVCDDQDVCLGMDSLGDEDHDGFCEDRDRCPGADDSIDLNDDGLPDACERPVPGALLSPESPGQNGQTRLENFGTLLDALFEGPCVTREVPIDGLAHQLPPWFGSSTICTEEELKAVDGIPAQPSFSDYLVVSDELSELAVVTAVGTSESRFLAIDRTIEKLIAGSTLGALPCWLASVEGASPSCANESTATSASVECLLGDSASDASARLGLSYYLAAANQHFAGRADYRSKATALAYAHLEKEYSSLEGDECPLGPWSGERICHWAGGGANTASGPIADLVMWVGYYPDIIRFLLAAYNVTRDSQFLIRAQEVTEQFLLASEFDGSSLTFARVNFRWDLTGSPAPFNEPNDGVEDYYWEQDRAWDAADAPRALWMGDVPRAFRLAGAGDSTAGVVTALESWIAKVQAATEAVVGDEPASCIQWSHSGIPDPGNCGAGYYENGLGSGLYRSLNTAGFRPRIDAALEEFDWEGEPPGGWFGADCMGIYRSVRPINATASSIGLTAAAMGASLFQDGFESVGTARWDRTVD